jgi:hypothetical protein
MTTYSDVLTKSMLIEWLAGVADDAPIALKINDALDCYSSSFPRTGRNAY